MRTRRPSTSPNWRWTRWQRFPSAGPSPGSPGSPGSPNGSRAERSSRATSAAGCGLPSAQCKEPRSWLPGRRGSRGCRDPATGQPIGEPLRAPAWIHALALAEGADLVLAACDGGQVIAWDAVTHLPSATVQVPETTPTALAVGEIDGRWVVAVGGASGVVQVRWIDGGELIHDFRGRPVRAVALGKASSGLLHLAIGYGDGRIAVCDVISGASSNAGILVPGELTDAALALMEGKLLVGAATTTGFAGAWDALSGAPVASVVGHEGEVSSIALASTGGIHLLATGGTDRTARVWYAFDGGSAGPPLPHPDRVESLAFGEVEGRTMLVTGCGDGNTRLWDPLRASAARVGVEGWFSSVAMDARVVAAEGEDGSVRMWDVAYGTSYPPLPVDPARGPFPLAGVRVWLGGTSPRILLAFHLGGIAIWDVSDPSQPAFLRYDEIGDMTRCGVHPATGRPLLATLDYAGEVMVSDLLAGTKLFQRRIEGSDSVRFTEAPEGRPLLGVGAQGMLHLLDIGSLERVYAPLPESSAAHVAVGRLDGADVLAALDAEGLRLYDMRTGERTIPPIEISSTANGIAWGRVGDRDVVVTAHFATVRVWNPRTGRKITDLRFGTRIGAMSVQQIDGGRLLVAVSGPGLVLTELREISF